MQRGIENGIHFQQPATRMHVSLHLLRIPSQQPGSHPWLQPLSLQVPPFLLPTPLGISPFLAPLLSSPLRWILQDSRCRLGLDEDLFTCSSLGSFLRSAIPAPFSQLLPLRTLLAALISTVTFCKICFVSVSAGMGRGTGAETLACVFSTST